MVVVKALLFSERVVKGGLGGVVLPRCKGY